MALRLLSKLTGPTRSLHKCPRLFASTLPAEIEPKDINNPLMPRPDARERKERLYHLSKHVSDMLRKKIDVMSVENGLLVKQKIVLEPLRVRHRLDNFDFLRSNKEVPCIINGRGDHTPIDLVVHQSQARSLFKERLAQYQPIYVLHNGEEIRCTIDTVLISPDKNFYIKVALNRYVVGEPNKIKVRMHVRERPHAAMRGNRIEWKKEEIDLISYNDVNPDSIEIDYLRLMRTGKFTFGDLSNILPRGLMLDRRYRRLVHLPIALLEPVESKLEVDYEHRRKMLLPTAKELRRLQEIDSGTYRKEVSLKDAKDSKKAAKDDKAKKPRKSFSMKKNLKGEQELLKKRLESHLAAPEAPANPKRR